MANVLIYTRLSTEDLHESTDRQEAYCRSYAEARGWTVLDVIRDVDASAYLPGSRRPGFEALVGETEARTCDGVVVWKLDRLVRRPADFERLWEIADRRGVFVASVMEPVDSSTPLGLALLRILVALAGLESATSGIRVRGRMRQKAERGTPPPTKAYGLTEAWDALVESEVAVLREAAERAIGGERLAAVTRDFRARKIPSATGGHWSDGALGQMLRNPRLVGDRAYQGEVVARDCWPAAFDRDFFAKLQLALNYPNRRGAPRQHASRLGTGFVFCDLCGQKMSTMTRDGIRHYSCPTNRTGCGRVHVLASALEAWLLDQLLLRLDLEAPRPEKRDTLETATAMRELCRDYYATRTITREEFLSTRSLLVRRADASARSGGRRREISRVLAATNPRAALEALSLNILREILGTRLERVTVGRFVASRRGLFEPGRLRCEWLGDPASLPPRSDESSTLELD